MEFFFLTQNITLELFVLISLFIMLMAIWSRDLYAWSKRVLEIFQNMKRFKTVPENITSLSSSREEPIEPTVPSAIKPNEATQPDKIDTSQVEKITNLVSSVRTLIARGMIIEAQTLIVEGLSLEKDNRDLNLLLGQIYEQEGQYEKAEYIYKDMAELHSEDVEILEKLANVLIIEKKNIVANEIYKIIHTLTGNTETTLYMLTHISNTLHDNTATLLYAKQYVLQWPKNPEIIALLAVTQVNLGLRKDAIVTYKNLKNLTPYSHEIAETIQQLLLEEELAHNFRAKEN